MIKKEKNQENTHNFLVISESIEDETKSVSKHMTDLIFRFRESNLNLDLITLTPSNNTNALLKKNITKIINFKKLFNSKNFILRGLNELFFGIKISIYLLFSKKKYCATIWYSPSIFIGFGVAMNLKSNRLGKKIMILRDIFPDWLKEIKVINKFSFSYAILKFISHAQYIAADVILVQSKKDKEFIKKKTFCKKKIIKVLYSWYTIDPKDKNIHHYYQNFCKKPYVLILGNLGIAQDHLRLLKLINNIASKNNFINFVFLGLDKNALKTAKIHLSRDQSNIFLYPAISQKYIPYICKNANCGIYSLNSKFKFNNIPGRFVMYSLCGLKSFGFLENNEELSYLIDINSFGEYASFNSQDIESTFINFFKSSNFSRDLIKKNSKKNFSTEKAFDEITSFV